MHGAAVFAAAAFIALLTRDAPAPPLYIVIIRASYAIVARLYTSVCRLRYRR